MKKAFSLILAFIMVLSCGATAFAAVKDPDASPQGLLHFTTHAYTDDDLFFLTVEVTANDSTLEYVSVGDAVASINPDKVGSFNPSNYYVSSKTILNGKVRITVRYVLNGNVSYSYATLTYK